MKTFYQFLQETYTPHVDHDKPDAYLSTIISKLTHEQQVLFALHCAEDCYELIKIKRLKSLTYNCIQLTKQWLNSPDKPSDQELRQAADDAANASSTAAAYAAYVAANAANDAYTAAYTAAHAAYTAADAYAYAYDANNANANTYAYDAYTAASASENYNAKIAQYKQDALIIGSSYNPDTHNTTFNKFINALKQGDFDKSGVEAFLDAIQEVDVLNPHDQLLKHSPQGVYLVMLPELKARTINDLADLLYKNKNRFMLALKTIK